jgi:IclR family acetate operon transcriptional repressor
MTDVMPVARNDDGLRGAQSVTRAVRILEALTVSRPALTLVEIAGASGLTPPTAHRLLRALQSHELVVFDGLRRQYSLGPGVMRLSDAITARNDVIRLAPARLQQLRDDSGETVALHWRVDHARVCMLEILSVRPLHIASGVGNAYPLVAGASGKAILAYLPTVDVDEIIRANRSLTKHERSALEQELGTTRERGYALSAAETVPGASAIAAPILDANGHAVAAINLTGPIDRLNATRLAELSAGVLSCAADLSASSPAVR